MAIAIPAPLNHPLIPASLDCPLGLGAQKLAATVPLVRWLAAPDLAEGLQVIEYPDHAIFVGLKPGTYFVGAVAGDSLDWCKVTVAGRTSSVDLSWIGNLIPSWGTLLAGVKNSAVIGLWAMLLWIAFNWPTPTPVDPPKPAPIPGDGFRALFVYETSELNKLSQSQFDALCGADFRAYLNSKCALGADGKTREWRIWDKDIDTTGETKLWQDAMKNALAAPNFKTPYAVISSTGKTVFSEPLPDGDLLAWIKQWGGK